MVTIADIETRDRAVVAAWDQAIDLCADCLNVSRPLYHPATAAMLTRRNDLADTFGIERR